MTIPTQLEIPIIGSKVNTKQVFIWAVIIVAAYLLIAKGIPAIISAIGGAVKSGINSMGDAIGGDAQSTSTYQNAAVWNNHYLDNMGTNDPFGTGLYPQHADASNLDYPTLVSIARAVRSAMGTGFLGLKISDGNESQFEAAFAPCQSQTDVSNVAIVYAQLYGNSSMMHDAVRDPVLLVNLSDYNPNGDIMAVDLQTFINKVNKMPVS